MLSDVNIYFFNFINGAAGKSPWLDGAMIFVANCFIFIIPLFFVYLWFAKKGRGRKEALFIFISGLLSLLISWGISLIYFHPRPFVMDLGVKLIQYIADSSFPSDHATAMFAVAFSLLFLKRYWSGTIFLILALLVGGARVFCGVHFPFDVGGSILVSFIAVSIVFMLERKFKFFSKIRNYS